MGRAFRYVRRISHIELVLAERGKNGESVATVVGEERTGARAQVKTKATGKVKARAKGKKPAGKPKKKFAGAR
jgi:large subunit ribosomal protein L22